MVHKVSASYLHKLLRFRCGAIRFPALFVADIKHMMRISEIFQKNELATLCASISFVICSVYGALCQLSRREHPVQLIPSRRIRFLPRMARNLLFLSLNVD